MVDKGASPFKLLTTKGIDVFPIKIFGHRVPIIENNDKTSIYFNNNAHISRQQQTPGTEE